MKRNLGIYFIAGLVTLNVLLWIFFGPTTGHIQELSATGGGRNIFIQRHDLVGQRDLSFQQAALSGAVLWGPGPHVYRP